MRFRAESGTFITWNRSVVTELGSEVTISSDAPAYWPVYWTPFTPAGELAEISDTVTVTITRGNEMLAETVLPITYDGDCWYSIGEGFTPPERAPRLEVFLIQHRLADQHIQAAQLSPHWTVVDANGNAIGTFSKDSPLALELYNYDDWTLQFSIHYGEIALHFTDNYPPKSISVQRWDAEYIGDDSAYFNGEPINLYGNSIIINDDGHDYIYEVYATWELGSSWYAFRVDGVK